MPLGVYEAVMIFFDTETCGLHGPTILLQYSYDNDPDIFLHNIWYTRIKDSIDILEEIINYPDGVCGFNLAYDWFHICQTYTTLILFKDKNKYPIDCINEYADLEEQARFGPCVKPYRACDIMLHARKGPYQSTMDRSDVRIKRVPTALAWRLAEELDKRIPLKDVYFARKKDKKTRWQVFDIENDLGEVIPEFKDIVLRFAPSSALKALAADALQINTEAIKLFTEVEPPRQSFPVEYGYAPYAKAPLMLKGKKSGKKIIVQPGPENWYGKWPDIGKIDIQAAHWEYNISAREYASDDVTYTRRLHEYFGSPEPDDDDSVLACMVGSVRWRGFAIDTESIKNLKEQANDRRKLIGFNYNSSKKCKEYLMQAMSPTEQLVIRESTKSVILEGVANWTEETVCLDCSGIGCNKCEDGLVKNHDKIHPAASRAQEILAARRASKEIEVYDKLLIAGRFHVSLRVIGTLSSRMSGADGLNPQGIKKGKEVRSNFPLADGGLQLDGGDFAGFEMVLMEADCADPALREDLMSGKKIHALFGLFFFPDMTYDEIVASQKFKDEKNIYDRCKRGMFGLAYGGNEDTLVRKVGISLERATDGYKKFTSKYKRVGIRRQQIFDMFCSMRQPNGLGSKVEWHEPADYIESMFGFKRYYTLENKICKVLFELAENPPKEWLKLKFPVMRRQDRGEQTACGALRSAIFAAAFAIQASNTRSACNHVIQSTGAQLTKSLQRKIWDLQPAGVHNWRVQPFNVHDEIMCPTHPTMSKGVTEVVEKFVEEKKKTIPLLHIEWGSNLKSWADK